MRWPILGGRGGLGSSRTWAGVMLLAIISGCAVESSGRRSPIRGGEASSYDAGDYQSRSDAPTWAAMPHSWSRLSAIEGWLEDADQRARVSASRATAEAYWRIEGRLQLAEGKLSFADAERPKQGNDRVLRFRREAAEAGFRAVMGNRKATAAQSARARRGLMAVERSGTKEPLPATASPPVAGLIRRTAWNAKRVNRNNVTPSSSHWNWITVHHSVFRPDSASVADSLETVRRIQRNHIDVNGWADIGYHYLIDRAGRVIEGRSLVWQGAHAGGANNRGNVGICLLGDFEKERPTRAALGSLDRLVLELQSELSIPRRNVRPHKAWMGTDCPGTHLMPWFARR